MKIPRLGSQPQLSHASPVNYRGYTDTVAVQVTVYGTVMTQDNSWSQLSSRVRCSLLENELCAHRFKFISFIWHFEHQSGGLDPWICVVQDNSPW